MMIKNDLPRGRSLLSASMPSQKILIDTDVSLGTPYAEIDDGAALIALLNSSAEIQGITTVYGNVPVPDATTNVLRLLGFAGREDIPVAQGAEQAFVEDPQWLAFLHRWQSQYGETPAWPGLRPAESATDLIGEIVRQHPDEITLLAFGPLTNLAMAIQGLPGLVNQVKEIVMMGGSLHDAEQAEFNIRNDPEAAMQVLQAGWPIRLLGLEITRQVLFTIADLTTLDGKDPALAMLQQQAAQWVPIVEAQGWEVGGCALHDAVAVAAVFHPEIFQFVPVSVQVIMDDHRARGVVQVERNVSDSRLQMAVAVDADACHDWILQALAG